MIKLTKAQQRLADARRTALRVAMKREDTIKLLVRLQGQLRDAERAVTRLTKAVRQERKDTKVAMAQAAEETRAFDGDLGHLG